MHHWGQGKEFISGERQLVCRLSWEGKGSGAGKTGSQHGLQGCGMLGATSSHHQTTLYLSTGEGWWAGAASFGSCLLLCPINASQMHVSEKMRAKFHSFIQIHRQWCLREDSVRMGTASTTKFPEVGRRRFRAQHHLGSVRHHSCLFLWCQCCKGGEGRNCKRVFCLLALLTLGEGFGFAEATISPSSFVVSKQWVLLFCSSFYCCVWSILFTGYFLWVYIWKEKIILEEVSLLFLEFIFFQKLVWATKHLFWQGTASPLIFCAFLCW